MAVSPLSRLFVLFQSTPPVRGATTMVITRQPPAVISIHAPRAGSDYARAVLVVVAYISIHAPRAGSDPFSRLKAHACKISIHAPRAGSDYARAVLVVVAYISIHAPRAGSDYFPPRSMSQYNNFNPRPPCGERQLDGVKLDANDLFQSTPPVRGATVILSIQHIRNKIFQSTPPVRGATPQPPAA